MIPKFKLTDEVTLYPIMLNVVKSPSGDLGADDYEEDKFFTLCIKSTVYHILNILI